MSANGNIPGLLVGLTINQWNNTREDDGISREVRTLHKLAGKAGKWIKVKLPDESLTAVRRAASGARSAHYNLTLPWVEGFRLLPLSAREKYETEMGKVRENFVHQVDEFVAAYPQHVEAAKAMHNGTFAPCDYPGLGTETGKPRGETDESWHARVAEMKPMGEWQNSVRSMFGLRWEFSPVPKSDHFVGIVAGHKLAEMQTQLEAQNAKRLAEAEAEIWRRVFEPLSKMAQTLGSRDAVFRDSLVGNIREVCEIVPTLNVTNNPQLRSIVQQVRDHLAGLDPDALRNSRVQRRAAADVASSICAQIGAMGRGRKITPAPESEPETATAN